MHKQSCERSDGGASCWCSAPRSITPQLHSYPKLHLLGPDACSPRHRNPGLFGLSSPFLVELYLQRRWPSNSAAAPLPAHLPGVSPKSCWDFGTSTCPGLPLRGQARPSSLPPLPAARTQRNYKPLQLYQPPGSVINDSKCPHLKKNKKNRGAKKKNEKESSSNYRRLRDSGPLLCSKNIYPERLC